MRVKITMILDIDAQAWMNTHGVERHEVRNDVNEWGFHLLAQAAQDSGVVPEGLRA